MTPSVRLSMDAHATLNQSLAAIWLPLWKEQSGQAWNTLCYKRQVIDVMALWWFCLVLGWRWQDPARAGSGRVGAGAALWHARLDSWTLRPELGSGTLAGDTGWGTLAWPQGRGHCWPSPGQGLCPCTQSSKADLPAGPSPDSPGLKLCCSLFLTVRCYAEATRITTKTADDWERGKWQYPKKHGYVIFAAMSQNSTTIV